MLPIDTTQIKNTSGHIIDNLDEFVKSLQSSWSAPVLDVSKRLIKDAKTSPTQGGQYATFPTQTKGEYFKLLGKFYLKYSSKGQLIKLLGFGRYEKNVDPSSGIVLGIPTGARLTDIAHTTPMGEDPSADPVVIKQIKKHESSLCVRQEYCQNLITIVSYPLDTDAVKRINNKNSEERTRISSTFSAIEGVATFFPMAKLPVKATWALVSAIVAVAFNETNSSIADLLRVDVSYGDVVIVTSAVSINDGVTVHAPFKVQYCCVIPSSLV